MIRPSPRWRIEGNAALMTRTTPNTLTSNRPCTWLMEDSSAPPNNPRPALLTSTSMRPVCESTVETRALTDVSSVTSHVTMVTPFDPSLRRRLVPNTVKPARASASALALPIPEEAPVTMAVFPKFALMDCPRHPVYITLIIRYYGRNAIEKSMRVAMRYEKGRKDASRRRIIRVAGERFRGDGIAATGLASIMSEAGLTNGAFYPHFQSKAELVGESVAAALEDQTKQLQEIL